MPHKPPPVPREEQSPENRKFPPTKHQEKAKAGSNTQNLKEQNQQGNIYQNTHNQGYQQDR